MKLIFDPVGTRTPLCFTVPLIPFGSVTTLELETKDAGGMPIMLEPPEDGVVRVWLGDSPEDDAESIQPGVCLGLEKGTLRVAVPAMSDTMWKYVAGGPRPAWLHVETAKPFVIAADASGELREDPVQVHSTMITALGDAATACAAALAKVTSSSDRAESSEAASKAASEDAAQSASASLASSAASASSASDALKAYVDARGAADEAAASANETRLHAAKAASSAEAAASSAVSASGAADRARDSAVHAVDQAERSEDSANRAAEAAAKAEAVAGAAAESAAELATSKVEEKLSGMVATAAGYAGDAAASAEAAGKAKDDALSSLQTSLDAATASIASARDGAKSEVAQTGEAAREALAADLSAASGSLTDLVTESEAWADKATLSAAEASKSADLAASHAVTSASHAHAAESSASAAAASATAASDSESAASDHALAAAASATEASEYAQRAEAARDESLAVLRRVQCDACTNLAIARGAGTVMLQWGDPDDMVWGRSTVVAWLRTELWAKPGGYPSAPGEAGAVMLASTERHVSRDRYLSEWVVHECGDAVFGYRLFSFCDNGVMTEWEANLYPMGDQIYTLPMMHRLSQAGTLPDFVPIGSTFYITHTGASAEGVTSNDQHLVKFMDYDVCRAADPDAFPHVATIQWVDCLDVGTVVFDAPEPQTVAATGVFTEGTSYAVLYTRLVEGTNWNEGDSLDGKGWYEATADWVFNGAEGTAVAGAVYWKSGGITKLSPGTDYQVGDEIRSLSMRKVNPNPGYDQGTNRIEQSNLIQYLNAEGYDWFSPMNPWDARPGYYNRKGFLSGFTDADRACLIPTRRACDIGSVLGGGIARYVAKVYLPTMVEVGLGINSTTEESVPWQTYTDNASRIKLLKGAATNWWLATPSVAHGYVVFSVAPSGATYWGNAVVSYGVAPALSI